MKNLHTFDEFLNESAINEGDLTREYDGFVVKDTRNKARYKFRYVRGTNSVKVENAAIQKVMDFTKLQRANFWVDGLIKRGQWDKDETPEFEG